MDHNIKPAHFIELAQSLALNKPNQIAYRFISREGEDSTLTYAELDTRARAIAASLQELKAKGQRALLLYLPGLDYIEAFFGCLYANVIAVPAYPPDPQRLSRTLPRLQNIIKDSDSHIIMSTSLIEGLAKELFLDKNQAGLKWLSSDKIDNSNAAVWKNPNITNNSIAFLQYTSGSTSNPRGVVLTHQNLFSNLELVEKEIPSLKDRVGVTWLPPYHDMGLIAGILQPMKACFPVVLMSPLDFLIEPYVWLKNVAKYKAYLSGGPNFAYELCVKRISAEQIESLDLSEWKIAANGAEPIRHETMEKFAKHFKPCGFNIDAFLPCYGLAEATLYVCGASPQKGWESLSVDTEALKRGIAKKSSSEKDSRLLVSSGKARSDQKLLIVDPITRAPVKDGQVGELWYQHPSVSSGYYGDSKKSEGVFNAYTKDNDGPFLQTGDLAFLNNGELFITGRQKDSIIIRGRNHYPQDIEKTVEESDQNVRFGCVAAFSIQPHDETEKLAIVCEIKNASQSETTIEAIKECILQEHDIQTHTIALIEAKSISKTSSGKIQRHASKNMLLDSSLDLVKLWSKENSDLKRSQFSNKTQEHTTKPIKENMEDLDTGLQMCVAQVLGLKNHDELELKTPLVSYGLDSLMRQELLGSLEELTNQRLTELLIDDKTTYSSLADSVRLLVNSNELLTHPRNISASKCPSIAKEYTSFDEFPTYLELQSQLEVLRLAGLKNPFFAKHKGLVLDTTEVDGQKLINFANYNYIGMAGHPEVSLAAKEAIDTYGTSVSASRLVSGDRPLHGALEKKIAQWIGVEDAIIYVSGHSTNVSTIGHLFEAGDLIVHDSLSHNSIQIGCQLSGAKSLPFPHNDFESLDQILETHRHKYNRVLIVIEGIYSMDGDIPNLIKFVEVKKKHQAFLMVDEAHSIGVLGKSGRGLSEHFDTDPKEVDLWMGTLSKSFASCGGYIAGKKSLIDNLRYGSPGFVYSVGLSPPNAAASLKSIEILEKEPERVRKLHGNSKLFLKLCQEYKLDTGLSCNSPIVPIIVGNSLKSLMLSERLRRKGVSAMPIIYPAVQENQARLRFFITSSHNEDQIRNTAKILSEEINTCASL